MRFMGLLVFLYCHVVYATSDIHPFSSTADSARFYTFTKEIRCVVCQNQSLADSDAPLAKDIREKIYRMIQEKKSNAEIKNYLVNRYGEFILLQPRFRLATLVLWLFPALSLLIIAMILYPFFRHR